MTRERRRRGGEEEEKKKNAPDHRTAFLQGPESTSGHGGVGLRVLAEGRGPVVIAGTQALECGERQLTTRFSTLHGPQEQTDEAMTLQKYSCPL